MSRIIFLHGASSSGKSTIAAALRDISDDPWMHLSFDSFRDNGALRPSDYADWPERRSAVFDAVHHSFQAFADAGLDLIIEHILDTPGWHDSLQRRFGGHDLCFVGVETPAADLEHREQLRGNRPKGSARRDAETIHIGRSYDLIVNGTDDPRSNARSILKCLNTLTGPSAFFRAT